MIIEDYRFFEFLNLFFKYPNPLILPESTTKSIWKTKFLFPAMGMIPIDRSGGAKSTAALDAAEG